MPPEATALESIDDYSTRMNLVTFFLVASRSLERLFNELRDRWRRESSRRIEYLNVLRNHAHEETARGTRRLSGNRMSTGLRNKLRRVGMYGEVLKAKLELLWECLKDGTLDPILKTLNSILGSLSGVLHFAEVLKEFKENMEVAVDSLGKEGGLISLNLEPPPLL